MEHRVATPEPSPHRPSRPTAGSRINRLLAAIVWLLWLFAPLSAIADETPSAEAVEFFENQIRPLLAQHCHECHANGERKGGLELTSRQSILAGGESGPAGVPGKPQASRLIEAVEYGGDPQMPPDGKLKDAQIAALRKWAELGFPWPGAAAVGDKSGSEHRFRFPTSSGRFWAFQPVRPGDPPAVAHADWPRGEIDRYILAGLEAAQLEPAPPADKRTLLRRATFDLTGLPPTPDEMAAFLADESPDAFAKVIERLLASPQYGERWGRHWLDVVRYADARDTIQLPAESDFREAWRYRDWVVSALNRDLPYDQFLTRQLAGDLLQPATSDEIDADALTATGMLAIADFVPGDVDKEQMIADYVNDQIDVVGRAFLGPDDRLRPLSRSQVRSDLDAGLLRPGGHLLQHPADPGTGERQYADHQSAAPVRRADRLDSSSGRRKQATDREPVRAIDRGIESTVPGLDQAGGLARYGSLPAGSVAACASAGRRAAFAAGRVAKAEMLDEHASGSLAELSASTLPIRSFRTIWPNQRRSRTAAVAAAGRNNRPESRRAAKRNRTIRSDRSLAGHGAACSFGPTMRASSKMPITSITLWPDHAGRRRRCRRGRKSFAADPGQRDVNGHERPVVRFDGSQRLQAARAVPELGSLFAVFRPSRQAPAGQRLLGWEDSAVGQHGVGMICDADGAVHAVVRRGGAGGDVRAPAVGNDDFQVVRITWGEQGVTLHRGGQPIATNAAIHAVSADPAIGMLQIGGPGSGSAPMFRGELAELRVYDAQLDDAACRQVEQELARSLARSDETGRRRPARSFVRRVDVGSRAVLGARDRTRLAPRP